MTKNKFAVKRGADAEEKVSVEREKEIAAEEEAAKQEKEAEEREKYLAEKLEFHAEKALTKEQLPVSFAKILCGESEEETTENIAVFKEEFMKAVEAALYEKLKGSTPKTYSSDAGFDPFLNGFGN